MTQRIHLRSAAFVMLASLGLAAFAAPAPAKTYPAVKPTEVKAVFREGQTFITWTEDPRAGFYRVYRDSKPITTARLQYSMAPIATVAKGSSRFQEMWTTRGALLTGRDKKVPPHVIARLCVQPVGQDNRPPMLAEDAGLLVWTVAETKPAKHYYAVTAGVETYENKSADAANTAGPVEEVKQPIGAVKYYVQMTKDKKTGKEVPYRDWYIMWMDYALWNPHYVGYAFPFAITRGAFKEGGPCPSAHLDGIGTMNAFTAGYTNYGCGDFSRNAAPTWYFGYGTKVRDRASGRDVKQEVANYVQYRILKTVLWARRKYKITDPRFIINGNSMGASGAIGFGLQFPKFVTAIWSNEGLTDYADTMSVRQGRPVRLWASSIFGNYGKPELKNPVRFLPFGDPQLDWVCKWNGENVYNVRNAGWFLKNNVDVDMPFLNIGHCWQDGSIPAANQAVPFEKVISDSRQCFSYAIARGGHGWGSAWGNGRMMRLMRWDESRPGFSSVPPVVGWRYNKKDPTSRTYMYKAAWGVKAAPVKGKAIEETDSSWSLPILHAARDGQEQDYFVDITPRNLQKMKVAAGQAFTFAILDLAGKPVSPDFAACANGEAVKATFKPAGKITADKHNLLLIPHVPIRRDGVQVVVKRAAAR